MPPERKRGAMNGIEYSDFRIQAMMQGTRRSNRNVGILERLWQDLPDARETLRPYVEKGKSFRNECGCVMGGVFLIVALATLIADNLFCHRISGRGLLASALRESAFVFGTSMVGKTIGIGVARMRLALLYRELRIRYGIEGG
jgi:hypothetical protein